LLKETISCALVSEMSDVPWCWTSLQRVKLKVLHYSWLGCLHAMNLMCEAQFGWVIITWAGHWQDSRAYITKLADLLNYSKWSSFLKLHLVGKVLLKG